MQVHFISDLHLSADHPRLTAILERYLSGAARAAAQLYILGDLFEYWAGDDDDEDQLNAQVAGMLREVADKGTRIHFLPGNRDFLLGTDFAARAGLELLSEPTLLDLGGQSTLLCHGDAECTDDHAYQAFRLQVRNPAYQAQFLAQPLAVRKQLIAGVRMKSEQAKAAKQAEIMDVNADAISSLLRQHGYPRLIHGHTHRPALHHVAVDGHICERWVLSDWRDEGQRALGEALVWDSSTGLQRRSLE